VDELALIVPDVHAPYHDGRAWETMLEFAEGLPLTTLIVLGDFADYYSVSSHRRNPDREARLRLEVEGARRCRADLDALEVNAKHFIFGNHEDRLTRYVRDRAPALEGLVESSDILALGDNGWELTDYRDALELHDTVYTHDMGKCSRAALYDALAAVPRNVVMGHLHRLQYVVEGDAQGRMKQAFCPGWLGDVSQVDYKHAIKARRDWRLGFGLAKVVKGETTLIPVPIRDDYTVGWIDL